MSYADLWARDSASNRGFYVGLMIDAYPGLWTVFALAAVLAATRQLRLTLLSLSIFGTAFPRPFAPGLEGRALPVLFASLLLRRAGSRARARRRPAGGAGGRSPAAEWVPTGTTGPGADEPEPASRRGGGLRRALPSGVHPFSAKPLPRPDVPTSRYGPGLSFVEPRIRSPHAAGEAERCRDRHGRSQGHLLPGSPGLRARSRSPLRRSSDRDRPPGPNSPWT